MSFDTVHLDPAYKVSTTTGKITDIYNPDGSAMGLVSSTTDPVTGGITGINMPDGSIGRLVTSNTSDFTLSDRASIIFYDAFSGTASMNGKLPDTIADAFGWVTSGTWTHTNGAISSTGLAYLKKQLPSTPVEVGAVLQFPSLANGQTATIAIGTNLGLPAVGNMLHCNIYSDGTNMYFVPEFWIGGAQPAVSAYFDTTRVPISSLSTANRYVFQVQTDAQDHFICALSDLAGNILCEGSGTVTGLSTYIGPYLYIQAGVTWSACWARSPILNSPLKVENYGLSLKVSGLKAAGVQAGGLVVGDPASANFAPPTGSNIYFHSSGYPINFTSSGTPSQVNIIAGSGASRLNVAGGFGLAYGFELVAGTTDLLFQQYNNGSPVVFMSHTFNQNECWFDNGFRLNTKTGPKFQSGTGAPNGVVTGSPGDIFIRTDGGAATTLYVKETGAATNTGWVGK